MESSSNKEKELSILDTLQNSINEANTFLQKGNVNTGPFRAWSNRVLFQLKKIYGENHEVIKMMSQNIVSKDMDLINVLAEKSQHLNGYISAVQRAGIEAFARNIDLGNRVFIGPFILVEHLARLDQQTELAHDHAEKSVFVFVLE